MKKANLIPTEVVVKAYEIINNFVDLPNKTQFFRLSDNENNMFYRLKFNPQRKSGSAIVQRIQVSSGAILLEVIVYSKLSPNFPETL